MPDFVRHPKSNTRTLINFQNVLSRLQTEGDVLLCVPVAVVDIIRKLVRDRGMWRTTYADNVGEIGYEMPTEAEFEPVREALSEFLEDTSTMNCSDFLGALNGIAAAIRQSSCCGNVAGPGYVSDGEGGYWYGTEQPIDKPATFGGAEDEFSTEAEFLEHLCLAANNVVNGIILSLNNWSVMSLVSLLAGSLIVAFFVATPAIGLFIALGLAGFAYGAFSTMSNYVNTNREDFVCAIYSAESYSDMLVNIDQLVESMIVTLDLGLFEVNILDLWRQMLSTDVLNQAYKAVGLPPVTDAVDCSICEPVLCMDNLQAGTWGSITQIIDNQDGTYWLEVDTDYAAGEDHERIDIILINSEGPYFNLEGSYTLQAGAPCATISNYIRIDNTTGTAGPNDGVRRQGLRAFTAIASSANSPNAATLWRFLLSCYEP